MRSLARKVAHINLKKKGFVKVNKKGGEDNTSYFSKHWREYV